jgi:aspartyl-tRNA(Asn)/glutamyl-tRNA(Gln) amidotransferase subunit A
MTDDLVYLSIHEAKTLIAGRRLSPVELADAFLRRIEALDARLHSFLHVAADRAKAAARAAEQEIAAGHCRGPLHGIPYGLKDVFDTAGIPTTANSPAFAHRVPAADATVERRLKAAGGILLGKQATHELTYGGVSLDLPWPPPRNPWNLAHDTGGSSSGGGAAVAAGLCMMAMGTDTGGSVRNPAAHCGIVGLKPTFGRISRAGVMMNSATLDHCGILARTARDCAIVLAAVSGRDAADPATEAAPAEFDPGRLEDGLDGLRIGLVAHFHERDLPANDEVREALAAALRVLQDGGARIEDVTLAPLDVYARCKATIQMPEIYAEYRTDLESRPDAFGAKLRARVMPAAQVAAADYVAAQAERRRLTAEMRRLLTRCDALVTAGPYGPAPLLSDAAADWRFNRPEITVPFSLTGFPAISICIGFTRTGLPLSMQVAAAPFDEATVLRVAHAYEQATRWHMRHPPLSDDAPRSRSQRA